MGEKMFKKGEGIAYYSGHGKKEAETKEESGVRRLPQVEHKEQKVHSDVTDALIELMNLEEERIKDDEAQKGIKKETKLTEQPFPLVRKKEKSTFHEAAESKKQEVMSQVEDILDRIIAEAESK